MSKVTMPEPVATAYETETGVPRFTPTTYGAAIIKTGDEIITTTQAEAYAAAKVRESHQWQPIETAPKDGKPRLLFARLKSATASTIVVGSLIEDEWLAQSYVGQGKAVLVPSHWMPLPPFPATLLPGPVEPTT